MIGRYISILCSSIFLLSLGSPFFVETKSRLLLSYRISMMVTAVLLSIINKMKRYFEFVFCALKLFVLSIFFILVVSLSYIPYLRKKMENALAYQSDLVDSSTLQGRLFTWDMYMTFCKKIMNKTRILAKLRSIAPNSRIYSLDGTSKDISALVGRNKLLVLVFGSLTCPVFRLLLNQLNDVISEFADIAEFCLVYIEEAHPVDGWMLNNNVLIKQHKTLSERITAASLLQEKLNCNIYVDNIENTTNHLYGGFPNRLYVIENGVVTYKNSEGPFGYDIKHLGYFLQNGSS